MEWQPVVQRRRCSQQICTQTTPTDRPSKLKAHAFTSPLQLPSPLPPHALSSPLPSPFSRFYSWLSLKEPRGEARATEGAAAAEAREAPGDSKPSCFRRAMDTPPSRPRHASPRVRPLSTPNAKKIFVSDTPSENRMNDRRTDKPSRPQLTLQLSSTRQFRWAHESAAH